jgi:hypothetical protein
MSHTDWRIPEAANAQPITAEIIPISFAYSEHEILSRDPICLKKAEMQVSTQLIDTMRK